MVKNEEKNKTTTCTN